MSEPVSSTTPTVCDRATSDGKAGIKFRLQLVVVNDSGREHVHEVALVERDEVEMETLGLTLAEGKLILKRIQEGVVQEQIHDALLRRRGCPACGKARHSKGHHDVTIRTLFGNLELQSPRLEHCPCQPHEKKTFSPLQTVLPEHTQSGNVVPRSEVEFSVDRRRRGSAQRPPAPSGRRFDAGARLAGVQPSWSAL